MADITADGAVKIYWLTSAPSNTSAPTTTELNAGVDLTPYITADGWSVSTSTADIDVSALNSVDNLVIPGRRSDEIEVTFKSQGDTSAPWTTFASRPSGYLVERIGVAYGTAWTAAQKVRIFPVTAADRARVPAAANEVVKFSVSFKKSGAVIDQATVA
jgi:hypothetical protein